MQLRTLMLVLLASIFPTMAHANTLDTFTLTGNGVNLSFNVLASPNVDFSFDDLGFSAGRVRLNANGKSYTSNPALFYLDAVGGGFALLDDDDLILNFAFSGAQLFSGPVTAPVFKLGNYSLTGLFCVGEDPDHPSGTCQQDPYHLTISNAAAVTPEPSCFLLMLTAAGGFVLMYRRLGLDQHA